MFDKKYTLELKNFLKCLHNDDLVHIKIKLLDIQNVYHEHFYLISLNAFSTSVYRATDKGVG